MKCCQWFLISGMLASGGRAFAQPSTTVNQSPTVNVLMTPIPANWQNDSVLSSIFGSSRSMLVPISFYLTNQTGRSVVGLCIIWTATDQTGKTTTGRYASDSFNSSKGFTPVIPPGGRILVIPGGAWMLDGVLQAHLNETTFKPIQLSANKYSVAAQVSVQIDTVIFSNGEVYGPDATQFASELLFRKQAADAVVSVADSAIAGGMSLEVALSPLLHPSVISDQLTAWKQRYARSALMIPNYVDKFLRLLPTPPVFSTESAN